MQVLHAHLKVKPTILLCSACVDVHAAAGVNMAAITAELTAASQTLTQGLCKSQACSD